VSASRSMVKPRAPSSIPSFSGVAFSYVVS
jgi:hypothetical protein